MHFSHVISPSVSLLNSTGYTCVYDIFRGYLMMLFHLQRLCKMWGMFSRIEAIAAWMTITIPPFDLYFGGYLDWILADESATMTEVFLRPSNFMLNPSYDYLHILFDAL